MIQAVGVTLQLGQSSQLGFAFTVAEVVAMGRQPFADTPDQRHDAVAVQDAAGQLDIQSLWRRSFTGLSGGEQQRVQLARALAQLWRPAGDTAPRYLLLDEPTAALDLRHRQVALQVARDLSRQGVGVLAVLHDLNLAARFADQVVLLRRGRAQQSGPTQQTLTSAALEACFDVPVEVLRRANGSAAFLLAEPG